MGSKIKGLTIKEKKFVDYFIQQGSKNQKEALLKAGYSESVALSQGKQILNRKVVRAYYEKQMKLIQSKQIENTTVLSPLGLRQYWTHLITNKDSPDNIKLKASELLARSYGMLKKEHPSKNKKVENEEIQALKDITTETIMQLVEKVESGVIKEVEEEKIVEEYKEADFL